MSNITNPHDSFFKEVFSRPPDAEDFVFNYLPGDVTQVLKPGSLVPDKDSFVDEELREYFSDLLYQVELKEAGEAFVYLLFEHKSSPAEDTAFQLVKYKTRIWERVGTKKIGSFQQIIPLVLYHGPRKWHVPRNFAALYAGPVVEQGRLDFTYNLCDLSAYTDAQIKGGARDAIALRVMKHIFDPRLREVLPEIFPLFRAFEEQTALRFIRTVLIYLSKAAKHLRLDDYRKAITAAFPEKGDTVMEGFVDQVREEGFVRGWSQAAASLVLRLLSRKFRRIDEVTEARIRQLSKEDLERLSEDLLDFSDYSDLLDWLDRA